MATFGHFSLGEKIRSAENFVFAYKIDIFLSELSLFYLLGIIKINDNF